LKEITLSDEQVLLCQAVLSQDLMKISSFLASGKDGRGENLTRNVRRELLGYSSRLQLTLLALGLDSAQIERVVQHFATLSAQADLD
jgi:hypothetical protein